MDQFEDPALGDVLDEQGQFGEGQGQQVVQLVDQAGALANGGLESSGDLTQGPQLAGQRRCAGGSLADGEVGGGPCFDGIGLLAAEQSGAIVFVALGVAARDGELGVGQDSGLWRGLSGEVLEEVQEVVGVGPGGIEANDEGNGWVRPGQLFESAAELGVAGGGLGEGQFGGGGLLVVAEEGGVVAVA